MKQKTKAMDMKERIIQVTIALIQNSNGDVAKVTTREIAEKAEVGNGLINYHFQTKEKLIAICVQRIIRQVVENFKPSIDHMQNAQERMTYAATRVFEFLFANPAISRISILNDLNSPASDSNTVKSQMHICGVMGEQLNEEDKSIFSFILVTAMQVAFLAKQYGETMTGYALDTPYARERFIKKLVDMLIHGIQIVSLEKGK